MKADLGDVEVDGTPHWQISNLVIKFKKVRKIAVDFDLVSNKDVSKYCLRVHNAEKRILNTVKTNPCFSSITVLGKKTFVIFFFFLDELMNEQLYQ